MADETKSEEWKPKPIDFTKIGRDGRMVIPQKIREYAGIDKQDCMVVVSTIYEGGIPVAIRLSPIEEWTLRGRTEVYKLGK
jgi:bifunctional DNA-binding transcriptional regulator/antitoxin component of YhaV-PrlF toxin-antitoxin module